MSQIDLIWPGDIVDLHDHWQKLIDDVEDLVGTVGWERAEKLVEGVLEEGLFLF